MTNQLLRPFDLAKIDTESIRKRRRKKILLVSLPFIIVLLIVGIKLVSLSAITEYSTQAYSSQRYQNSAKRLAPLGFINSIEQYKYHYNSGTSQLRAGMYEQAEASFNQALKSVSQPDECFVRVNLVLALIGQSDKAMADKEYNKAILGYDKAKAVIDARDCGLKLGKSSASSATKEAAEKLEKKREEINKKQSDAKKAQNGDKSEGSGGDSKDQSNNNSDQPSESQQKELNKKQAENDQKTRKARTNQRGYESSPDSYSDRSYKDKNW